MEQFKIAKWGNSYAIRIPSALIKELGLKEGDPFPGNTSQMALLLRARLDAERERSRLTLEEADAVMEEARRTFPQHLRPEDWKIDRNDPDMRG